MDVGALVNKILTWVLGVIGQIFQDLFEILGDAALALFDAIMALVMIVIGALPSIPGTDQIAQIFASIPPEWMYLVWRLNVPQCLGLYVAALGIRLLLQLIPAVRLGS